MSDFCGGGLGEWMQCWQRWLVSLNGCRGSYNLLKVVSSGVHDYNGLCAVVLENNMIMVIDVLHNDEVLKSNLK